MLFVKLFLLLSFLKPNLFFLAEQFAGRPGAVKGAFCASQRTLDGEDRSATLPPGKEGGPICACFLSDPTLFPKALFSRYHYYYCRHPSIRTLDERFLARCKLGVLVSAGAAT
jgi:hypothetical protein